MSHKIKISAEAKQDLNDIWDYIANRSITNADRYLDRLLRRIERLGDSPLVLGNPRDYLVPGLRGSIEGSHVIFYMVYQDRIVIIRILHQKQDHPSYFD